MKCQRLTSWVVAAMVLFLGMTSFNPSFAQRAPTHELVRRAAMVALETLPDNAGIEIVTQGSWNSLTSYVDPLVGWNSPL